MTRLLPVLLVVACGDARTQKDDDLARVCLAYDHLRTLARVDTMTGGWLLSMLPPRVQFWNNNHSPAAIAAKIRGSVQV